MDAAEFPLFVQIQLFMLNNASLRYTRKNIFKGRAFDMRLNICALQTLQTNGMLPILMVFLTKPFNPNPQKSFPTIKSNSVSIPVPVVSPKIKSLPYFTYLPIQCL
ncbi:12815_t:CDS:2, partial [Dentiscutata erythropus]